MMITEKVYYQISHSVEGQNSLLPFEGVICSSYDTPLSTGVRGVGHQLDVNVGKIFGQLSLGSLKLKHVTLSVEPASGLASLWKRAIAIV